MHEIFSFSKNIIKSTNIWKIFLPGKKRETIINYDNSLYYITDTTPNITKNNALYCNEISVL